MGHEFSGEIVACGPGSLTLVATGLYIRAMADSQLQGISEQDLHSLETRVEELIHACTHLKAENRALRAREESLLSERASLIEKNDLARSRVEAMISRLKSLEDSHQ